MYPVRFEPIFRRYLWGGRRLATELGKDIGNQSCAESWEIVDRPEANSRVLAGEFSGKTLHDLIADSGPEILGAKVHEQINRADLPQQLKGRFPLLLKFLDASKTLSVQVHPDDMAGKKLDPPDLGKTEAWYVMNAQPGSQIYSGLKPGIGRTELAAAIESRTTDQVLHTIPAKTGDCIFVPAGTVHAIGEGLLIAEIQQCSDTTFRLFDWNRTDEHGNSRDLHIQQALQVTDYDRGPVDPQPTTPTNDPRVSELVHCNKFRIRHWTLSNDSNTIHTEGAFRLLMVTKGKMLVAKDATNEPLERGQTILIPACCQATVLTCDQSCEFLEIAPPA